MSYNIKTWESAARQVTEQLDFCSLASTPNSEECTPAGRPAILQIIECNAYIHQLIRIHGEPPTGAEFFIVRNLHELGEYYEAGIFYVPPDGQQESDSMEYMRKVEMGPAYWDEEAKKELRRSGHTAWIPAKIIATKKNA